MIETGLTGQVVLVTGGAGGIGAAISRAFAAQGAHVVIHHLATRSTAPDGVTWEHTLPDGAEALAAGLERHYRVNAVPLGRPGDPTDIADAVVFLASRQARWITGQVLQVAGGQAL